MQFTRRVKKVSFSQFARLLVILVVLSSWVSFTSVAASAGAPVNWSSDPGSVASGYGFVADAGSGSMVGAPGATRDNSNATAYGGSCNTFSDYNCILNYSSTITFSQNRTINQVDWVGGFGFGGAGMSGGSMNVSLNIAGVWIPVINGGNVIGGNGLLQTTTVYGSWSNVSGIRVFAEHYISSTPGAIVSHVTAEIRAWGPPSLPPINGLCGSAHSRVYTSTDINYSPFTQCSAGSPSNTNFPVVGGSQNWTCSGTNAGSPSLNCSASRLSPLRPHHRQPL
jgi:hypothetical protein